MANKKAIARTQLIEGAIAFLFESIIFNNIRGIRQALTSPVRAPRCGSATRLRAI